jgi:hypothetical protein
MKKIFSTLLAPSVLAAASIAIASSSFSAAQAAPVTYAGTDNGVRSSEVIFDTSGTDLLVTLTNTSLIDVTQPDQVLTAVFFNLAGTPTLTTKSALLNTGSSVFYDPDGQPTGGNVGGEWVYKGNALYKGKTVYGIGASGLAGTFGNNDTNFKGLNLAGPTNVGGLDYGLLSAGDNTTTGNGGITGSGGLVKNSIKFTLSGLAANFDLSAALSNISFQYGTSPSEASFAGVKKPTPPKKVPEPATAVALGLFAVGALKLTVKNKKLVSQA